MSKFRFQDLEIWKMAIELTDKLFDIADKIEKIKYFRVAEQLRAAGLSISNNIAEGSGSDSKKDFSNFLNFSRRSSYESANIIIILNRRNLIEKQETEKLLTELDHLCRKTTNFQKSLKT